MAGAAPIQVGDPTQYILEEGHVSFLYRPQASAAQCMALKLPVQLHGATYHQQVHASIVISVVRSAARQAQDSL